MKLTLLEYSFVTHLDCWSWCCYEVLAEISSFCCAIATNEGDEMATKTYERTPECGAKKHPTMTTHFGVDSGAGSAEKGKVSEECNYWTTF